ncbi:hypothetical protein J9317_07205 [Metabacillus sp. KIGAM252]|uniref:YfhD family protein n=1 Tax=Metabacillus flavus TaxID=2823519 RepID=A0ABS5LCW2_9BACI|nr:hypothetical protein [Metabacillus flavus]MBS2968542.1 hypothetical protein [Metabacillus flavus]
MSKKHVKSKNLQNHKKPMNPDLLEQEFGSEFCDANSGKIYELKEELKRKSASDKKKK